VNDEDREAETLIGLAWSVIAYAFAVVVILVCVVGLLVFTVRSAVGRWRRR
jgi:hypothetical protein